MEDLDVLTLLQFIIDGLNRQTNGNTYIDHAEQP